MDYFRKPNWGDSSMLRNSTAPFWIIVVLLGSSGNRASGEDWLKSAQPPSTSRLRGVHYRQPSPEDAEMDAAGPPAEGEEPMSEILPEPLVESVLDPVPVHHVHGSPGRPLEAAFPVLARLLPPYERVAMRADFDWLMVRPTSSQAVAFNQVDDFAGSSSEILKQHGFDFQGSPRIWIAASWPGVDAELRLTVAKYGSEDIQTSPISSVALDPLVVGQGGIQTDIGEFLRSDSDVSVNTFDLEYGKRVPLLSPCDPNVRDPYSPCGGMVGPRDWNIHVHAGVRIANVHWNNESQVIDLNGATTMSSDTRMNFTGFGPRLGMHVERFIGPMQRFSFFAEGNASLLAGHYKLTQSRIDGNDVDQRALHIERVAPIGELELGLKWYRGPRTSFSAGYLFHAYADMGFAGELASNLPAFDDANILAFDGLFASMQVNF